MSKGTATITAKAGKVSTKCVVTVIPPAIETERAALVALYKATGGDRWTNRDNWCSDKPVGEWYGVVTNEKGRVTALNLNMNNLTGKIPPELFSLSQLNELRMTYNNLTGEIPKEVANAKELETLSMESNQLTGSVPESLPCIGYLALFLGTCDGDIEESSFFFDFCRFDGKLRRK